MPMIKTNVYQAYCHARAANQCLRVLHDSVILPEGRMMRDGCAFVNFSSNDYLGLSQHPALVAGAREYAEKFGGGATASRLITGNHPAYAALEARIAAGKKKESALLLASGYQTNLTVVAALADREVAGRPVAVIADRLAHNSLLQGAILAGARLMRFRHNDYDHLGHLLGEQTAQGRFAIVVSESVFGMDGDRADVAALGKLAQAHEALLYIDEAHATGVLGSNGFGLTADNPDAADIAMGTFSKGLGCFGSYIACSAVLREYLIQRCGGLVYSTAMPPALLGSIAAALDLVPALNTERAYLLAQAERMRKALYRQGWDCGNSTTQIVPVIVGTEKAALEIAAKLLREGFLVPAIRPPTVPKGASRLRVSLSAAHRAEDIDAFIAAMEKLAPLYTREAA